MQTEQFFIVLNCVFGYEKDSDTYLFGVENKGIGVFHDKNDLGEGWYANVTHPDFPDIECFGPCETKEEMAKIAIAEYQRILTYLNS